MAEESRDSGCMVARRYTVGSILASASTKEPSGTCFVLAFQEQLNRFINLWVSQRCCLGLRSFKLFMGGLL